jgi:hypothetical protein
VKTFSLDEKADNVLTRAGFMPRFSCAVEMPNWGHWIALAVGYGFAVIIGHFCVALVVDRLWKTEVGSSSDKDVRPGFYLPKLVGIVERVLFVASLQLGKGEFIGVWFVLKVAGKWKRWSEGAEAGGKIDARVFYNIFLIGSALSLAYSVVGAELVELIDSKKWSSAVALPAALIVGTFALHLLALHYQKAAGSRKEKRI